MANAVSLLDHSRAAVFTTEKEVDLDSTLTDVSFFAVYEVTRACLAKVFRRLNEKALQLTTDTNHDAGTNFLVRAKGDKETNDGLSFLVKRDV